MEGEEAAGELEQDSRVPRSMVYAGSPPGHYRELLTASSATFHGSSYCIMISRRSLPVRPCIA